MIVRNLLMCLLSFSLLMSMNRVALAAGPYSFERLWSSGTWAVTGSQGVATDSANNLYVVSEADHRVMKISSAGNIISQWGSPGSGDGQFNLPRGVAVDSTGNVYVADYGNDRIQKFDTNGTYLSQWNASDLPIHLKNPTGVAVDSTGVVYVTETGGSSHTDNNRVLKFSSSGVYLGIVGLSTFGIGDGQFWSPSGIAFDSLKNMYVADSLNNRIQKFDANGIYLSKWNSTGSGTTLTLPKGVSVYKSGANENLYVTDNTNSSIQKFGLTGTSLGKLNTNASPLNFPTALARDGAGNLWVADTLNNRIAKFNSSDTYQTFNAITGGTIAFQPSSVAVDGTGKRIYLADITNNRILRFAPDGTFQTWWGSQGTASGAFNNPGGVAVDASGNVYVADTSNNRIQKFDANGAFIRRWGGTAASDVDGQFFTPSGVAVDTTGYVYVADTDNGRIQKFTPNGLLVAKWSTYDIYGFDLDGNPIGGVIPPTGLAVDSAGYVFVVYRDVNLIQKFNSAGNYVTQWGSTGTGDGQFTSPQGVAVDSTGNVFVADTGNSRIQKFDANGAFLTAWGTQSTTVPAPPGEFSLPYGVAADVTGNIYVADTSNLRVQKFTPSPRIVMTVSGSGSGTVERLPELSCSSSSSQPCTSDFFTTGSIVTLTATPTSGASKFQSWGGDCSACATGTTCQVTMNSSKTCSASFDVAKYPLNVTISGNGNVNSTKVLPLDPVQPSFSCNTTGVCSPVDYLFGTIVTLSAIPSTDYIFSGWSTCPGKGTCDVTMSASETVTAIFTYVKPVRVVLSDGITLLNADGYDTLSAAYAVAPADSTIQARTFNFLELQNLLMLGRGTTVSIKGGYDETFTSQNGYSVFKGKLEIPTGKLVVDHFVVQQP